MGNLKKYISFQDLVVKLIEFWSDLGCLLIPPADVEIPSILFHPVAFFNGIEDKFADFMYIQSGTVNDIVSPNTISKNKNFLKFQVVVRSEIKMPQKVLLDSLLGLGFLSENNDFEFKNVEIENNIFRTSVDGYRLIFNSMEIATMGYVQSLGNTTNTLIPLVITYNLEKLMTILQGENDVENISLNGLDDGNKISYKEIFGELGRGAEEFVDDGSTSELIFGEFNALKEIAARLLERNLIVPAYVNILKANYYFNILVHRNFISNNNRISYEKELRTLVDVCCLKHRNKNIVGS